jgi:hypothetical protein
MTDARLRFGRAFLALSLVQRVTSALHVTRIPANYGYGIPDGPLPLFLAGVSVPTGAVGMATAKVVARPGPGWCSGGRSPS